jgi:hypothetical protein
LFTFTSIIIGMCDIEISPACTRVKAPAGTAQQQLSDLKILWSKQRPPRGRLSYLCNLRDERPKCFPINCRNIRGLDINAMHLNAFVGFSRYLLLPSHTSTTPRVWPVLFEFAPRHSDIVAYLHLYCHISINFTTGVMKIKATQSCSKIITIPAADWA